MTIDEAIRYCEKQADLFAQEQRKKQNINPKVSDELLKKSLEGVDRNRQFEELVKELQAYNRNRQFAEWLKELKAYRENDKEYLQTLRFADMPTLQSAT